MRIMTIYLVLRCRMYLSRLETVVKTDVLPTVLAEHEFKEQLLIVQFTFLYDLLKKLLDINLFKYQKSRYFFLKLDNEDLISHSGL